MGCKRFRCPALGALVVLALALPQLAAAQSITAAAVSGTTVVIVGTSLDGASGGTVGDEGRPVAP